MVSSNVKVMEVVKKSIPRCYMSLTIKLFVLLSLTETNDMLRVRIEDGS